MARPISDERKQQWQHNILNQHDSGLSIAAWCRLNKIAVHKFYYWQKKLLPKSSLEGLAFAELINEERGKVSDSGIVLEYQGISIHLSHHFVSSALKRCLEVLKGC
jgi:hypothetical protein